MKNFYQTLFIGLLIFGAIIQMSFTSLSSFGFEYNVAIENDIDKYVVSTEIQEQMVEYENDVGTGSWLENAINVVFGSVVEILKNILGTFGLVTIAISSISDILFINPIIATLIGASLFIMGIFALIRALSNQGET